MNPKKIAILRANALGDFLVTLPAIESLKAFFPAAEITLLGAPWHKDYLVPGRCAVDKVIVVPAAAGIRGNPAEYASEYEMQQFFEEMRSQNFDMAFHFQGNGLSANPFLLKLGAAFTAGCTTAGAPEITRSIPFYYYQSEIMRYLEVVSLAGASAASYEGRIHSLARDEEEIASFLRLMNDEKFVVIHPFSADIRREWHDEYYPALADALTEEGYQLIFTGLAKDAKRVESIIGGMRGNAFNACGLFSLGGLTALYKQAALVIAPDTGPLHLARAVGTPTVGMYWAPNFINWAPVIRSCHQPLISWRMECALCGVVPNDPYPFLPQQSCKHETSFIGDISPEKVADAALTGLKNHSQLPIENGPEKLSCQSA